VTRVEVPLQVVDLEQLKIPNALQGLVDLQVNQLIIKDLLQVEKRVDQARARNAHVHPGVAGLHSVDLTNRKNLTHKEKNLNST
jgi:hypothetical protein